MKDTKGSQVKLKGTLRHGLYVLEGTSVSGSAAIASGKVTDMPMLWHKRLAHVSERGLQALSQQGLLGGVKDVELPFCEHCIMGKSTRVKFGKGKHTTKGGEPNSIMVKYLMTYNGLEFVNKKFNNFCKFEGMMRHFTITYTPHQNGLAERFNRTTVEHTRSPSIALSLKAPQEVWTCKASSLDHLRMFRCTTYAHVRDGKLNKRALKCMFIGYRHGVKSYKLWCLEKRMNKFIISRDVTFNEIEMFYCVKEQQKQQTSDHVVTKSQHDWILIDEGAFIEQSSSNNDLENYHLTRDRTQRERHALTRYGYADLVAYALTCATDSIEAGPLTFKEAIVSDSKKQWKDTMEAELFSLQKNQTWSLVPKPPNQKLIQSKWIYKIKPGIGGESKPRYKARLMDVTTTFLHGELDEVIYMAQPKGYEVKGKEDMGFHRNSYDACVYWKLSQKGTYIYLLLYVGEG
ncbi:Retrovirus-related Pol polyprotein from transposon TNT 1-94 [Cucumis melo var. makuwa]|uniref:Retrovirus-related Pol polyprotein from transposon TNT 1-94 n=1 Tax=Cucumis melo var. makuwa TaxID=1194695 RepID=A0A5D3D597_CUCMM|nr:Retrovirus-related Pol polyprotein from transposon TNT 1-94 [Cucumis melo var. makuwa]